MLVDAGESVLEDLMKRFEGDSDSGNLKAGDVEMVGRYLFDCLLGRDTWAKIVDKAKRDGQPTVELALSWDSDDHEMHRLSWEAMHDGNSFICAHPDFAVAIVRVVADAPKIEVSQCTAPARVLFAIGADLNDPDIRPGAEIIGLLRGADQDSTPIEWRIADGVTITRLGEACRRFRPHVVHIVSHGKIYDGKGWLQLVERDLDDDGLVDAEMLAGALHEAAAPPALVVLTGCMSAAGGDHVDPLAAELVKRGLPAVVGMSGEITDQACRLFSRRLGIAISRGEGVAEAMAHGRRAGLMEQGDAAADDRTWAMPSIFLAPSFPAFHAPIDTAVASTTLERVIGYGLHRRPIFCGRRRLEREFDRLLDSDDELKVLVAYTESHERLGKTRILHEFAGRALWAGHFVVLIDDYRGDKKALPSSDLQLAAWLLESICKARHIFKLEEWFESELLDLLESALDSPQGLAKMEPSPRRKRLRKFLGTCKRQASVGRSPETGLGPALVHDLELTVKEAIDQGSASADCRPVLVLGGIGNWGSATDLLCHELLGSGGLRDADAPVPVFATGTTVDDSGSVLLGEIREASKRPWARYHPLTAFEEHEDTLAYEWVLLHPWSSYLHGDVGYAPNRAAPDGTVWELVFRDCFEGIPGCFEDPLFYKLAHTLETNGNFIRADDERILEAYARRHDAH